MQDADDGDGVHENSENMENVVAINNEMPISSFIERKLWGDSESLDSDKMTDKGPGGHHHPMWDINESWLGEEEGGGVGGKEGGTAEDGFGYGFGMKKRATASVTPSGSAHNLVPVAKGNATTSATNIISGAVGEDSQKTDKKMLKTKCFCLLCFCLCYLKVLCKINCFYVINLLFGFCLKFHTFSDILLA